MLCRVIANTNSKMRRQLPDLAAASSRLSCSAGAGVGLRLRLPCRRVGLSVFFASAASALTVLERRRPISCATPSGGPGQQSFATSVADGMGRGSG
jgi:hypothetical protein